jgi:hypothetical protein
VLAPNDGITFTWGMSVPADAPLNSIAWNSFGYVATRTDNGSLLESAEPQKVGLQVIGPGAPPCTTNCQPLPPTGTNANIGAIIAVLLLVGGTAMMLISRRPSPRAPTG